MRPYPRTIPVDRTARARSLLASALAVAVVAASLLPAAGSSLATNMAGPNPVLQWNAYAIDAATAACFTPGVDGDPPAESTSLR